MDNQFYRTDNETMDEVLQLLDKVDPKFAAKTAVYARNKFHMRSITHFVAAELANRVKGEEWTKDAYERMIVRPDDMTETMAYFVNKYGKTIPHSLKKGWAKAFEKFDEYQLAKYRGKGKEVNLWDVLRVAHPQETEAVKKLVYDKLRNQNTWEAKQSKAGKAETEEAKTKAKKATWTDLLNTDKLGYMALLKNLRNIINDAPDMVEKAVETLTDRDRIRKSKVLPFRFTTAYNQISQESGAEARKILQGLSVALDRAMVNVPRFEGRNLVAIDTSGSMMGGFWGQRDSKAPIEHAAVFGATLAKAMNADIILFDTDAEYFNYNPGSTTIDIYNAIKERANGGGTNMPAVFSTADRPYDRIVVLSDNESWMGYHSSHNRFQQWKKDFDCNPLLYCFDLAGYGTLQFPEQNVLFLPGS
jgi:uncharacterized protein with von Willebrand factor type A (vWA) domain